MRCGDGGGEDLGWNMGWSYDSSYKYILMLLCFSVNVVASIIVAFNTIGSNKSATKRDSMQEIWESY